MKNLPKADLLHWAAAIFVVGQLCTTYQTRTNQMYQALVYVAVVSASVSVFSLRPDVFPARYSVSA